ncbi:MAG TPA: response regulator [Candidatus Sabulitectum sp.]|nr:response regulator [Candidatus Sabulitectum sp.]
MDEACPRAILADDEEAVLGITRLMLERLGYQVITASNGAEAVARFAEFPDAELVMLDLSMPVLSGERAAREIRGIRDDVPVVITSGFTREDFESRFQDVKPAAFLRKPFSFSSLSEALSKLGKKS